MIVRTGTQFQPNYAAAGADGGGDGGGNSSAAFNAETTYAELDKDSRDWLAKNDLLTDPKKLAQQAYNQDKLIGSSIRIPKDDAPPEEKNAFLNKLGRPEKPDGYEFAAPKSLPEGLPYDGERATAFKTKAHELGLTKTQAAALHDWFVEGEVGVFNKATAGAADKLSQRIETAKETLVKLYGPLDGATAKANFALADQVFTQVPGGAALLEELKGLGLVGPNKEIFSAPIAQAMAAIGTALFTEDGVLRGQADQLDNPFAEATHNLTEIMRLVKHEPDRAASLAAAAGKKLSDYTGGIGKAA